MKILLSAFQCNEKGVSEGYLGARWYNGLKKHCDISLITGDPAMNGKGIFKPSDHWSFTNKKLSKFNSAIKLDYFWFNRKSVTHYRDILKEFDILHHVSPVAPRYPVSLSKYSKSFILGPVAGGLRVPGNFIKEVEGAEELFFKLRQLDSLRFKYDQSLISTYERAEKIIIAGEYVLSLLPEKFHSKCTQMLDVGIDTNLYEFKARDVLVDTLNLVYVGRVVPYKGLIYLLKALSKLPKDVLRNTRLDIAGNKNDNAYEKECKTFIERNGLNKVVKFHGFISKGEVQSLYEKAHVFCFPSLAEAGGTVVLEAMAKGLPVLAVDYGGPSQSVDNSSGVLVEPSTPKNLVDELSYNIQKFFSDRDYIVELGVGARKRVEENFDWEIRCKKVKEIYKSVL